MTNIKLKKLAVFKNLAKKLSNNKTLNKDFWIEYNKLIQELNKKSNKVRKSLKMNSSNFYQEFTI